MLQEKKKNNVLQYVIAVTAACLVFAIMQGIHDNYGIMMRGIMTHTGLSYARVSFAIAVGQIMYGLTPPLFGMLAIRKSNSFVMMLGILLMAVGLIVTPFCHNFVLLIIFFGLVLPTGTGALTLGVVMGALSPILGGKRASTVSGILQASAGIGDAIMSPALQQLTDRRGITTSMPTFAFIIIAMLPVVFWLGSKQRKAVETNGPEEKAPKSDETLFQILRDAAKDRTYWLLLLGFSTCGFHMAIIETHLYSQYISYGIPNETASLTLTVYGIMTMIGAVVTGLLGEKFKKKNVLGSVYAIRVLIDAGFIFLPKNVGFAFAATALLGATGDSTVSPTTSLVTEKVGVARMAIVYGSMLMCHQIGAFVSAWLGGILVNTALGYTALWIVDACLCTFAAVCSYLIKERKSSEDPRENVAVSE